MELFISIEKSITLLKCTQKSVQKSLVMLI